MAPTSLPANNGPAAAKPWEASAEKSACATVEHRGHRIIDAAKHRMSAAKPVPGWFFNTRTVLFSPPWRQRSRCFFVLNCEMPELNKLLQTTK